MLRARTMGKIRVLFFAEAVTLAHAARPVVLARSLDPEFHEVHLAWDPRYQPLFGELPFGVHEIHSERPDVFLQRLARGLPVYSHQTLRDYAREDTALLQRIDPDVVVGDFRLSLAASAPALGKPYLALVNAYWSPYARLAFPLPEHPMNRVIGLRAGRWLFDRVRPLVFAWHSGPLNRLRRDYGLPDLGRDLREIYCYGDQTLFPDLPHLVPTPGAPPSHHYVGPLLWSPLCPLPPWWDRLPAGKPRVYLNLGSSGDLRLLPAIADALIRAGYTVMAATGTGATMPGGVFHAPYLPGQAIAARAALVVCNGGSPTTQQALAEGVPVLGVARNLDQYLNMASLEAAGVGLTLRSDALEPTALIAAARRLTEEPEFAARARTMGEEMRSFPTAGVFAGLVARAGGGRMRT